MQFFTHQKLEYHSPTTRGLPTKIPALIVLKTGYNFLEVPVDALPSTHAVQAEDLRMLRQWRRKQVI